MTSILTTPSEYRLAESTSREELLQKVDDLFERYLELLDDYQKTRQNLSSCMSLGFISLAQSNFASRVRLGQDQYDDRMKAWRRAEISQDETGFTLFDISCQTLTSPKSATQPTEDMDQPPGQDEQPSVIKDSEKVTQEPHQPTSNPNVPPPDSADGKDEKIVDPIRWFGVLVPPALRSSQNHFAQAVDDTVPRLCAILREMRTLESEIGRTRKQVKKLS